MQEPDWHEVEVGHFTLCHFAKELSLRGVDYQATNGDLIQLEGTSQAIIEDHKPEKTS